MLILLFLFWSIDVHSLVDYFSTAKLVPMVIGVLGGLLLVQMQVILSALRWQLTARALGLPITTADAVREYYLASLMNQALPGGVTGDAARVLRSRHAKGTATAAHSVMIERLAGQVVLLGVTVAGLTISVWRVDAALLSAAWTLIRNAIWVSLALIVVLYAIHQVARGRVKRFIDDLRPAVNQAWFASGRWKKQLILSVSIVGSYVAMFALAASAVSAQLPPIAWVTVVPLTLLAMALPISIGGWGVREAAAAVLWPLLGMKAEAGIATSVLYGLISLAGSLPGLAFVRQRAQENRCD